MKRTSKILLIATMILMAGVFVWIAGMSIIGWDFSRLDTTKYTAQSYSCQNEVTSVSVDLSSFPLTIKKGDGVALDYYDADNSEVTVEEKDGALTVVEKYKYMPFKNGMFGGLTRSSHKFELTVVSGMKFEIKGQADIMVDGVDFEELSITSVNANIRFVGSTFGALNMDIVNGDIELSDCSVGTFTLVGTNTDCEFDRLRAESVSLHTVNADVDMDDCKISEFKIDATNVDISAQRSEFRYVAVDGTNTDCDLTGIKLDTLIVDSTNLSARIEIVGQESEYTVTTEGNRMPTNRVGTTDKLIKLSGTNNSVKLKFI